MMRTDLNNNPAAFTVDLAKQAGLVLGSEYEIGTPFDVNGQTFYTAKIVGDVLNVTLTLIGRVGFYTQSGLQRWTYIAMPNFLWDALTCAQQIDVIGFMYQREGGTNMRSLFPNYGRL